MNRHERRAAKSAARAKGQVQTGNDVGETVNRGIALINAGNYQQAEQVFRQLLIGDMQPQVPKDWFPVPIVQLTDRVDVMLLGARDEVVVVTIVHRFAPRNSSRSICKD